MNECCIFPRFRDIAAICGFLCAESYFPFPHPNPIPPEISECYLWTIDSWRERRC